MKGLTLNIIVCLKQVPDIRNGLQIEESKDHIREAGLNFKINEADDYALQEALLIKEKFGGEVIVISVGSDRAREVLVYALAKGADRAVHVRDEAIAGSDGFVVAKVLADVIRRLSYDLILTGVQSEDEAQSYVGVAVSTRLALPHASSVTKVEVVNAKKIGVEREMGGGQLEVMEIPLPALLTIQSGICELRYTTLLKIMQARKKEVKILRAQDLTLDRTELGNDGSRLKIVEIGFPESKRGEIIAGEPREAVIKLIQRLQTEAKVL